MEFFRKFSLADRTVLFGKEIVKFRKISLIQIVCNPLETSTRRSRLNCLVLICIWLFSLVGSAIASFPQNLMDDSLSYCFNNNLEPFWGVNDICEYKAYNNIGFPIYYEGSPSGTYDINADFPRCISSMFSEYPMGLLVGGADLGMSVYTPVGTLFFYGDTHSVCYKRIEEMGYGWRVLAKTGICPVNNQGNFWQTGPFFGLPIGYDANSDGRLDGVLGWNQSNSQQIPTLEEGIYMPNSNPEGVYGAWNYMSISPIWSFSDLSTSSGYLTFGNEPTTFLNPIERELFFGASGHFFSEPDNSYIGRPNNYHSNALNLPVTELAFFVPTGAVSVGEDVQNSSVFYWYGKYIANVLCDQSHVSRLNLYSLGIGLVNPFDYIGLFSERKFIQINAIPIEKNEIGPNNITIDPLADGCSLPWEESNSDKGLLIFGTGYGVEVNNAGEIDPISPPVANTYANTGGIINPSPPNWSFRINGEPPFLEDKDSLKYCANASQSWVGNYRKSKLYLSFVGLNDLNNIQAAAGDVRDIVYYYVGQKDANWQCKNGNIVINNCWCQGKKQDINDMVNWIDEEDDAKVINPSNHLNALFGEFSIKEIPDSTGILNSKYLLFIAADWHQSNLSHSILEKTISEDLDSFNQTLPLIYHNPHSLYLNTTNSTIGDTTTEQINKSKVKDYKIIGLIDKHKPWVVIAPDNEKWSQGYGDYLIDNLFNLEILNGNKYLWFSRSISPWSGKDYLYMTAVFYSVLKLDDWLSLTTTTINTTTTMTTTTN